MEKYDNLVILDGNAIIHRAYYAIPTNLYTKSNELVNAVFGFTMMLLRVIETFSPKYIVCTFDLGEKTFRNELYGKYKANRKKMDDDLASQLERIREVVRAFNIPIFEKAGYEADDIIGTLVRQIKERKKPDLKAIIVSGDRDILQLLDKNVEVVLPGRSFSDMIVYDEAKFYEKFGFDAPYLIDFKAIRGDTSDNIPGVAKIGDKGATDLIKQYKTLENIYHHLEVIKPALSNKLKVDKENAFLSKKLATIVTDVPIILNLDEASFQHFNSQSVEKKFFELEFKSLLPKVFKLSQADENVPQMPESLKGKRQDLKSETYYTPIQKKEDFEKLLEKIRSTKLFSLDTETTSLNIMENDLVAITVGFSGGIAFYIPIKDGKWSPKVPPEEQGSGVWGIFLNILRDTTYKKIGHHVKFDMHALMNRGIRVDGIYFDTMVASFVLNLQVNDLKGLALLYENIEMTTYNDLTKAASVSLTNVPVHELIQYACADADLTYKLYTRFEAMLQEEDNKKIKNLFYNVEIPLIPVLFDMERTGIILDVKYITNLKKDLEKRIAEIQTRIFDIVGHEFNISSPKQLSEVIFNELQLPKGRKTKTGYSTDDRYFTSIGNVHPIVQPIREFRELVKLKSTYVETLPLLVDNRSRIHTSYNQTVAITGRLSSANPNLQNIPVRTEIGNTIRKAFIAKESSIFVAFDYSQIELRLMAHMSQDPKLLDAFMQGMDIHEATAKLIFNKDEIHPSERRVAKTINFGIIYGMSSFGLSQQLGMDRKEAQTMIEKYYKTYEGLFAYLQEQREKVLKTGFVETLLGKRRIFRGIDHAGSIAKNAMLREAVNMPLQGTAAEIIKIAMIRIFYLLQEKRYPAQMILQVHDELIFEYTCTAFNEHIQDYLRADPQLIRFCQDIKGIMEHAMELSVPLKADVAVGKNWGELEEIKIG